MASFVHIAPAKLEPKIRRNGLRGRDGVYAFPVTPNFMLTHQWTRELQKWLRQPMVGVQFRVPDAEPVTFGCYNRPSRDQTAAVAIGESLHEMKSESNALGFRIIIARAVKPKEITRITPIRGIVGWRHMPNAHGAKPCGCPGCIARGEPGGRKLRQRYERGAL